MPRDFATVVGNEAAVSALRSAVSGGRSAHSYLIAGSAGSGRKTLAVAFAAALFCRGGGALPCGECPQCRKVFAGQHPDLSWVRGTGETGTIKVDAIREARLAAYTLPNEADWKLCVVDGAEQMTEAAQNALLKILEEPPASAKFLLLCENPTKLLPTVRSRVISLRTTAPAHGDAVAFLTERCPDKSPVDIDAALRLSGGYLGGALALLSDDGALGDLDLAFEALDALSGTSLYDACKLLAAKAANRKCLLALLDAMGLVLRDVMLLRAGAKAASLTLSARARDISSLAMKLTNQSASNIMDKMASARAAVMQNASVPLTALNLFLQCWEEIH
ncbi:ATP-binding protein [Feifania hominis]|uniref:DNA polymerase III subunit delta n=1 Tax=Feifania hominis TaxID=2763660 RepID=A0A926DEB8_9FIRM|nr:DNA polymerase III subunit delta' [Feifania hominis]MBC8536277.1 hypothetical protein [Feifania hominis]